MFAVTQARSKIEQLVSLRKSSFERPLAMPGMHSACRIPAELEPADRFEFLPQFQHHINIGRLKNIYPGCLCFRYGTWMGWD